MKPLNFSSPRLLRHQLWGIVVCVVCLVGNGRCAENEDREVLTRSRRGLTGTLQFYHSSPSLAAKANQSGDGPVFVRLELSDDQPKVEEQLYRYDLRFFGMEAGRFDLAQELTLAGQSDGGDIRGIGPLWVDVVSDLPSERGTNLYEIDDPAFDISKGYRTALITLGVLWGLVPLGYFLARTKRQDAPIEISGVSEPGITERLFSIANKANDSSLSYEEKAEFELLLYAYWQERLGLSGSVIDSVPVLRRDENSFEVILRLERMLHAGARKNSDHSSTELLEILRAIDFNEKIPVRESESVSQGEVL